MSGTITVWRTAWQEGGIERHHDFRSEGGAERQQAWLARRTPPIVAFVYPVAIHLDEELSA